MIIYQLSYGEKPEISPYLSLDLHVEGCYSSPILAQERQQKLIDLKIVDPKRFNFTITPIELDNPLIGVNPRSFDPKKIDNIHTRKNIIDEEIGD